MGEIRWIHISDLHFGCEELHTIGEFRKALPLYAKDCIASRDNIPTYLFVTGDMRYAKSENLARTDYSNAADFLNKVSDSVGIPKEHIFVVLGNHDVSSDSSRINAINQIMSDNRYMAYRGTIAEDLLPYLQPENEFKNFYKNICGRNFMKNHWLFSDSAINVLYLDSSIVSIRSSVNYGKLLFGTTLVDEAIKQVNRSYPVIVLAHHSWDWIRKDEKEQLEAMLKDNGAILYLAGILPYMRLFVLLRWPKMRRANKQQSWAL